MKDLKAVMQNMQSNMQQTHLTNQQNELLKKQVSENAKSVIDDLFNELKSCYPAWKQAFDNREAWNAAKKTWTKAFIENNISNQHQVSLGLAAARKGDNPFWPSVGQFINWCDGPEIDTDEAFNRMIDHKPYVGVAEYETRQEVGFRCKQQLPEDKARALFKKVLTRNIQRVKSGELIEHDINPVQIASPEVFRETETQEARNIRLDAEIATMQASGTRLIGPYKKRHLETKG
jgi:hypothetical protein